MSASPARSLIIPYLRRQYHISASLSLSLTLYSCLSHSLTSISPPLPPPECCSWVVLCFVSGQRAAQFLGAIVCCVWKTEECQSAGEWWMLGKYRSWLLIGCTSNSECFCAWARNIICELTTLFVCSAVWTWHIYVFLFCRSCELTFTQTATFHQDVGTAQHIEK